MCGVGVNYAEECAGAVNIVGGSDSDSAVVAGSYESYASDGGIVGGEVGVCSDECGSNSVGDSRESDSSATGE